MMKHNPVKFVGEVCKDSSRPGLRYVYVTHITRLPHTVLLHCNIVSFDDQWNVLTIKRDGHIEYFPFLATAVLRLSIVEDPKIISLVKMLVL